MPNKKDEELTLTMDSVSIEIVNQFNFLACFTLILYLNWRKHMEKIANRCSRSIGIITKLMHFLQTKKIITLYNLLILSHLN